MRRFFSLFFLLVMIASVAVSVLEQCQGDRFSMMKECGTDDTEEDTKTKTEKEKEIYTLKHCSLLQFDVPAARNLKSSLHADEGGFISDEYTFLPEIPPDAAFAACLPFAETSADKSSC